MLSCAAVITQSFSSNGGVQALIRKEKASSSSPKDSRDLELI